MIKFNSAESFNLLDQLEADQQSKWGKMTPQHMVEHLTLTMKMSVGKIKIPLITKEEDLPKGIAFLNSEKPLPKNFTGIVPKDVLIPLKFKNLETAKSALKDAVAEFTDHYKDNHDITELHPVFGPLDKQLWEQFHNKHFTHHFRQFGLIKESE